jgi:hypothetical protein
MREKIKVLFLAADPFRETARLELGEEMRAIDHAIQQGNAREALELVAHFATQTADVQTILQRHRPQIVHFAGHGDKPGVIYLGDNRGAREGVGKAALTRLFGALGGVVRVVVLNGCHTLSVATALSGVVDYAIGTRDQISDDGAIQFADAFYTALAFGSGVRQAFDLTRLRLRPTRHGSEQVGRLGRAPAVGSCRQSELHRLLCRRSGSGRKTCPDDRSQRCPFPAVLPRS